MTAKKAIVAETKTSPSKSEEFSAKKIGANLIVTIGTERYARKVSKEEGETILGKITIYNKKPTDSKKKEIIKLLAPVGTKVEEEKEKTKAQIKGVKHQAKKEGKEEAKEVGKKKAAVRKEADSSSSEGKEYITYTKNGVAMKGFESIIMPQLLVDKITAFLKAGANIEPLLNFWSLCLLNPNEIARTKLFAYLSHHRFIITPSGYFVTYRLVKKTGSKDVFTDAHTRKFKIKIGEIVSIPRTECDEDGSKECSKGLHVGSPAFIGVSKGEGYNKERGQIGTGYVNDNTGNSMLGDQAIIAFVNPAHVVSVPDSDTRKLRCCEYYPFKLTTAEEIISVEDANYFVYEADYKKIELEQLMASIGKDTLKEYYNPNTSKSKIGELKKDLDEKLAKLQIGKDTISPNLKLDEVKDIVLNRVKILSTKYPSGVQL